MFIPSFIGAYNKSVLSMAIDENNEVIIPYLDPYWIVLDNISNKKIYLYSLVYVTKKCTGKDINNIHNIFSISHFNLNTLWYISTLGDINIHSI